jgi:transposase
MSYSLDFRIRVFKIQEKEGLTFEQTAARFAVPIRTLFRWKIDWNLLLHVINPLPG